MVLASTVRRGIASDGGGFREARSRIRCASAAREAHLR